MFKSTDKFHLLTQKAFKNYQLKQNEYLLFWDYIQESSDNLIYFFSELTHTIMRLENSKKSSKLESLDSIIATLYCLSMFKKILADKKRFIIISDLEKEWQLYDKTRYGSMIRSPYSGEIVNCVFQFLLKSDDKSRIENILDQIAIIPGSVKKFINISNNSQNNISLADLEYNSFQVISEGNLEAFHKAFSKFAKRLNAYHKQIKQDSLEKLSTLLNKEEYEPEETGECSLIYEYFIQFLNENKKKKNTTIPDYIINSLLTNLRVIPFIALRYPKHAENSLLCLLYIIKQILIFFPLGPTTEHEEQEILSILIGLIKNYITWPFPIGFLAVELIDILKSEIIATGNSFRYRIREEIPALDILDYELRKNVTYLRIAYCIYNENYYSIISGIKSQNSENFDEKTNNFISLDAHKIRVLIIAHVFSIHYKITRDLLMHMSYLNPTDIFRIYCKLLNILEKCENVDSLDIINLQEKTLDELSLEIYNCVTENSEVSFKIQDLLFQEFQSFLPTYPDVFLELVDHRQNNINIDDKIKKLPVIPEIEENNMEDNNGGKFDERKILGNFTLKLKELLEEIIQNSFPLHQESFKIVVFGEDEELHSLVQELGVLFKMNYLLFTNIDIRIFIIPVGRCTMGKYLASKDLWYNRNIYLPFNQDLLFPKLETHSEPVNSKPGGSTHLNSENIHLNIERIIFPFFLKEKILQSYLREANRIFQVKVYEILCFKVKNDLVKKISFLYVSDKNQTKNNQSTINFPQISKPSKFQQNADIYPKPEPNETYFFSMYLEIGESAEKQKYKAEKKLTDEALEEAIEKGLLKFKNTDLEINANYMDIDGNLKSIDTWRGLIQNIKINNIYKDGFEGNPPMPASDFLEMTIIDYENSKQRDHSAKHASLIAKYGREQLQNAFFALNMSFSIYSAVITEPSGKEFDICVDGKVYGGFQQIIIQPLISQEKKDFKLMIPIMTFLPLNI